MCTKAFTSSVFCFPNNVDDKSRSTGIETVFLKLSVHLGKCSEWWTGLSLLPLFTHKWERLLKSICSFKMQNYINEVKCSKKFINSQYRHIKALHHLSSLLRGTISSTAAILPHFTPMWSIPVATSWTVWGAHVHSLVPCHVRHRHVFIHRL